MTDTKTKANRFSSCRALLLQARSRNDPMCVHEQHCFAERAGLSLDSLYTHNLLDSAPSLSFLRSFDLVFVGGSGEFCASKRDQPNLDEFLNRLCSLVASRHPIMAVCYGFHCLAHVVGAQLCYVPESTEVGSFDLWLTDDGQEDPILGQLPERFSAQMGHKDHVSRLGPGMTNLVSSELSEYQAFRCGDAPIWAVQFHPELTEQTNRDRYEFYREGYDQGGAEEGGKRLEPRFCPSPYASSLLRRFVEFVLG